MTHALGLRLRCVCGDTRLARDTPRHRGRLLADDKHVRQPAPQLLPGAVLREAGGLAHLAQRDHVEIARRLGAVEEAGAPHRAEAVSS